MDAPKSVPTSSHLLPENVVEKVLSNKQTPVNPHSQRLLAAEARAAQPVAKPNARGKAKAKATSKAKAKSESAKDDGEKTEKKKKKSPDDNNIEPTRTEYSQAKKKFMQERPVCNIVLNRFQNPWD